MNRAAKPAYPLHAFPLAAREAIGELLEGIKAPLPLVGTCVLSAMSAAAQGKVMVKLPMIGAIRPATMYFLVVADSGERKSAVDAKVFEPIKKRDQLRECKHRAMLARYQIEYRLWKKVETHLIGRIAKLSLDDEECEVLQARLLEHGQREPSPPCSGTRLRQNLSMRALVDDLNGEGKSLIILSDEGQIVLEGPLLQSSGFLNKAWDGGPIQLSRANGVRVFAQNVNITFSIMVQSSALKGHLRKQGDMPRGTGFWARFLITWPDSTMGTRFTDGQEPTWKRLGHFHELIEEMMGDMESEEVERVEQVVYEMDEDARAFWIELVNQTEVMVQPWGHMSEIRDYASKVCEITARIAALFHHFSRQTGKISRDTLQRAADVVNYHIHEYKVMFSTVGDVPQVHADAQALESYLQAQYQHNGGQAVPRNNILKSGPIRPKSRFDPALQTLVYANKVVVTKDAFRRTWIWLPPQYSGNLV